MLLAVMEKRCGFKLGAKDVFLNIAGGIRVDDPAIDLAVVAAVLSSNADLPIQKNICLAAEVGLSGEVRPVNRIEQRIYEAENDAATTFFFKRLEPLAYRFSHALETCGEAFAFEINVYYRHIFHVFEEAGGG